MIAMLRRDWNEFLFSRRPGTTLGLFRALLGIIVLSWCVLIYPDLRTWYTEDGMFTLAAMHTWNTDPQGFSLLTLRSWTTAEFGTPLFADATGYGPVLALFWALVVSALMLAAGYKIRLASILVYIFLVSFHHRDLIILNGGDTLMRNMAFLLMFADSGAAVSIDRQIDIWKGRVDPAQPVMVEAWPLRLMQLQLAAVYLSTALSKICGDEWRDGSAYYYASQLMDLQRFSLHGLNMQQWFFTFATYFCVATELSMGTLIFVPRLRPYVMLMGIVLHVMIEYTMTVPLFAITIVSCYLFFIPQRWIDLLILRLHGRLETWRMHLPSPSLPHPVLRLIRAQDVLGLIALDRDGALTKARLWQALRRMPAVWALVATPLWVTIFIRALPSFLIATGIIWPALVLLALRIIVQRAYRDWSARGEGDIPDRDTHSAQAALADPTPGDIASRTIPA